MAEKTTEQVRDEFMNTLARLVQYWNGPLRDPSPSQRERLDGLAFSFLCMLDGVNAGLPAFIVAPCTHPDDQKFHEADGSDWYPSNVDGTLKAEITGGVMLHDLWKEYSTFPEQLCSTGETEHGDAYAELIELLPKCAGKWLSGSGGHIKLGPCGKLATYEDTGDMYRYACDEHLDLLVLPSREELPWAEHVRKLKK